MTSDDDSGSHSSIPERTQLASSPDSLADPIIAEELSTPARREFGQRPRNTAVLFPGPHPRSTTVVGSITAIRSTKSTDGRVLSSPNRK